MSNTEFTVMIPARYGSSRLPGKLLADICGKSMIQRVIEQAMESAANKVIVAVDDERIADNVTAATSATVISTSPNHASGTDRLAEAAELLRLPADQIIVNLQGDEPLMPPTLINQVAEVLQTNPQASIGTAAVPMDAATDCRDPNRVKCVVDRNNQALYFSRSAIPWNDRNRRAGAAVGLQHIGIYAYTVDYLVQRHARREVCMLEKVERLEQLRALYHGDIIVVHIDEDYRGIGVDTAEELEQVRELIASADQSSRRAGW